MTTQQKQTLAAGLFMGLALMSLVGFVLELVSWEPLRMLAMAYAMAAFSGLAWICYRLSVNRW